MELARYECTPGTFKEGETETVEAVQFLGSSTQIESLKTWLIGGDYIKPALVTRDIRELVVRRSKHDNNPDIYKQTDWVVKRSNGLFVKVQDKHFTARFKKIDTDYMEMKIKFPTTTKHRAALASQIARFLELKVGSKVQVSYKRSSGYYVDVKPAAR